MKRFRLKAASLGLALAAGGGIGAEGPWHTPGEPPAPVVIPAGAPGLLPAALRGTPTPAPAPTKAEPATLWFPARQPASAPATITPVGGIPAPAFHTPPQPQGQPAQPERSARARTEAIRSAALRFQFTRRAGVAAVTGSIHPTAAG